MSRFLEIVAVVTLSHVGLLASKLGKKASTYLGAIQRAEKVHVHKKPEPMNRLGPSVHPIKRIIFLRSSKSGHRQPGFPDRRP